MSPRRMLEGRTFDLKAAAALVEAFNGVVAELDLRTLAERERAAKIVIALAARSDSPRPCEVPRRCRDLMRAELVSANGTDHRPTAGRDRCRCRRETERGLQARAAALRS